MATPTFSDYRAALDVLMADLNEIKAATKRLGKWSVELQSGKRRPDASALKAETKTMNAQLGKLDEMTSAAEARYLAKVDSLDEAVVEKFQALTAIPLLHPAAEPGAPRNRVGEKLLHDTCKDFAAAKGNYAERHALFNAVIDIADSVTSTMGRTDTERRDDEAIAIYKQFNAITDPEAKSAYYTEHKSAILAGSDLLKT